MAIAWFDIEVDEETDYSVRFTYTDVSTNLPVDLTDYTASMEVRVPYSGYSSSAPVLLYTSDDAISLGGEDGTIDVNISADDTADLTWDKGVYSIILVDPDGKKEKFISGFFTVIPQATTG